MKFYVKVSALLFFLLFLLFSFLLADGAGGLVPPTPTASPSPIATAVPATSTATAEATLTAVPSATAVATPFGAGLNIFIPAYFVPEDFKVKGYAAAYIGHWDKVDFSLVGPYYRHYPWPQDRNPYRNELVPMVKLYQFDDWLENYPRSYDGRVFGLNEPTLAGDGYATPAEGCAFFEAVRASCPNCELIGPHLIATQDALDWYAEFKAICDVDIAGVGIHHFDNLSWLMSAEDQLAAIAAYGDPIYVTELASCDPTAVVEYLDLYQSEPLVREIYYFAPYVPSEGAENGWPFCTRLFDDAGDVTAVGAAFFWEYVQP